MKHQFVSQIVIMELDIIIFYVTHWLFTAHYIRIACLYRMLFSRHSEVDLKVIRNRNFRLKVLTVVFVVIIVGV